MPRRASCQGERNKMLRTIIATTLLWLACLCLPTAALAQDDLNALVDALDDAAVAALLAESETTEPNAGGPR